MHTSLCVIGVLPDLVVSVVLGLGFCRWASAHAVHESVGDDLLQPAVRGPSPTCRGRCSTATAVITTRLAVLYHQAMELELRFFDAAAEGVLGLNTRSGRPARYKGYPSVLTDAHGS